MESVSQAVLGAAIGEITIGDRIGRKALLWGAVVATLPDLDVLANPLIDDVAELSAHRNITHSILFVAVASPIIGWILNRIHAGRASKRRWIVFASMTLLTAILLDCFNVYGTQVFQPFSSYRIGFDSISIIDPLFTTPLLVGFLIAVFIGRNHRRRRTVALVCLAVSSAYLLLTLAIKTHVTAVAERSLEQSGAQYTDFMTSPTIGNTVLWWVVYKSPDGTHVGYYSLFDDRDAIDFIFVPSNIHLLEPIIDTRAVRQLLWFSDGYFTVTSEDGKLMFSDLRFGEIRTDASQPPQYVFTWEVVPDRETGEVDIAVRRPDVDDLGLALNRLIQRAQGI